MTLTPVQRASVERPGFREWYGDLVDFFVHGHEFLAKEHPVERKYTRQKAMDFVFTAVTLCYVEADGSLSPCVTAAELRDVFYKWHDSHGHYSFDITMKHLRGRAFWWRRTRDVEMWCRQCPVCQACSDGKPGALPMTVGSTAVWSLVGMDFIGPFHPLR